MRSRYVWHQHVPIGLEQGLTREEFLSIATRDFAEFSPAETPVLKYATALVTGSIDDATHSELARFVDEHVLVAIVFLASEYLQVSRLIDALAVDLEDEFTGWQLQQLL